ncbi:hypothetical protein DUT90_08970 [Polaribacter sp. WD7]|uniref:T9SS type B sorting domain-containing protein n=1 Tax=Polaribacter sp. WD7 TaxID=2269061 RepID=UPI000DF1EBBD|nr:T9SS type B sorting domain-containing protein [Polaribacter sp. WD7]RCS27223.1 hypothetical protein DUT90_08970 [Polaribacter sp. WD7]
MKKYYFLIFLLYFTNFYAQKEANFWYFGENAGLDFSSGAPVALTNGELNTQEGCSTISDKDGNLLFYSDGIILYNSNHEVMTFSNGNLANDLGGNPSSTQSALFVPNPENQNLYYLFTLGTNSVIDGIENPGLKFYTIDKSKENGLGQIIDGPITLGIEPSTGKDISEDFSEKVTAIQGDCNSIWVLSAVKNQFYAYNISENGVDVANPVISTTDYELVDKRGYLKISPNGKYVALADFKFSTNNIFDPEAKLVLYEFNDQTGIVSPSSSILTNLSTDGIPYGVEFSQNSSRLYTSTIIEDRNLVFQFDLRSDNIFSSKTKIYDQEGFRSALQLGPDGKIYASIPEKKFLDVIENPNDLGTNVRYIENAVDLKGKITQQGLPPFIQSFFSPVNIVNSDDRTKILNENEQTVCIGENLNIEPELIENPLFSYDYLWTKEGNNAVNIKTRRISITNSNFGSGTYNLQIITRNECGKPETFNSSIKIKFTPKPNLSTVPLIDQCDFDNDPSDGITNFNLEVLEKKIYDGNQEVEIDFFESTDINFSSPLNKTNYRNSTPTKTADDTHKIVAKVTIIETKCFLTTEIELKATPSGVANFRDVYTCEFDVNKNSPDALNSLGNGTGFFNFNEKTTQIIANSNESLSLNTHNFQYYRNRNDAITQTAEITEPFEDTLLNENDNIFVRISLKNSGTCQSIGNFKVIIQDLPFLNRDSNSVVLCVNNPRDVPQERSVDIDASTGLSSDTFLWYKNNERIIGATTPILKVKEAGNYRVEIFRDYENDRSDLNDDITCRGYYTFIVLESNRAVIQNITVTEDQNSISGNSITINISGEGDYEYSLNSQDLSSFRQGENNLSFTFNEVEPGLNTVFVRDKKGCGISASESISFLQIPKHFSPNEDGVLDTWKINGINNVFYIIANLEIFDRYGTLLKKLDLKTSNGWNGFYQGKLLPQNDYWFKATLVDINGNVRTETGHFSLITR